MTPRSISTVAMLAGIVACCEAQVSRQVAFPALDDFLPDPPSAFIDRAPDGRIILNWFDTVLGKYIWCGDADGQGLWMRTFDTSIYPVMAQAVDPLGGVTFIFGTDDITLSATEDSLTYRYALVHLDQSGGVAWSRSLNVLWQHVPWTADLPKAAMHYTASGDLLLALSEETGTAGLIKLDENGDLIWAKEIPPEPGMSITLLGMELTANGGCVVMSMNMVDHTHSVCRVYDVSGNVTWAWDVHYPVYTHTLCTVATPCANGDLVVGGWLQDLGYGFLMRLGSNGVPYWFRRISQACVNLPSMTPASAPSIPACIHEVQDGSLLVWHDVGGIPATSGERLNSDGSLMGGEKVFYSTGASIPNGVMTFQWYKVQMRPNDELPGYEDQILLAGALDSLDVIWGTIRRHVTIWNVTHDEVFCHEDSVMRLYSEDVLSDVVFTDVAAPVADLVVTLNDTIFPLLSIAPLQTQSICPAVGISDTPEEQALVLHPNVVSSGEPLLLYAPAASRAEVLNMLGQAVGGFTFGVGKEHRIDTEGLSPGAYRLVCRKEDGTVIGTHPFVIR